MRYTNKKTRTLVKRGAIDGYEYFICDYGTHPCGYINLDIKKINVEELIWQISVHGGITYAKQGFILGDKVICNKSELVIGWDYAHSDDQYGEDIAFGRKYDVEDIMMDIRNVIKQLKILL